VTLAIEPGQFIALVGSSGAGKSTLMKTLLGLDYWASRYSRSTYCDQYVRAHLSSNQSVNTGSAPPTQVKPSIIQQATLLTQRYWQLVMRDRVNLTLALITAPIGISLITLAVKNGNAFIPPEKPEVALATMATKILLAYGALVNINSLIPEATKLPDGSLLPRPLEPTSVYDPTWQNLSLNWGILLVHCMVCLSVATWFQKRKDVY
jgi:ABC transporter